MNTWSLEKESTASGGALSLDGGLLCRAEPWEVGKGEEHLKAFWKEVAGAPSFCPSPISSSVGPLHIWTRCVAWASDLPRAAILPAGPPFSNSGCAPVRLGLEQRETGDMCGGKGGMEGEPFIHSFIHSCAEQPLCTGLCSLWGQRWVRPDTLRPLGISAGCEETTRETLT